MEILTKIMLNLDKEEVLDMQVSLISMAVLVEEPKETMTLIIMCIKRIVKEHKVVLVLLDQA